MNKKYYTEELLYNLPDYVSDKIKDIKLKNAIESEIKNNNEFKEEFESLKSTMNFVGSVEFETPGDNYFSGLSVRINEKIHHQSNAKRSVSFQEFIVKYWKLLVPALCILIFAIISLFRSNNDNRNEIVNVSPEKVVIPEKTITENLKNEKTETPEIKEKINITDTADVIIKNENKRKFQKRNADVYKDNFTENDSVNIADNGTFDLNEYEPLADIFNDETEFNEDNIGINDDILLMDENIEADAEEEFNQLSPEEQKEVIEKLIKSTI